jgi:hypothetical protein
MERSGNGWRIQRARVQVIVKSKTRTGYGRDSQTRLRGAESAPDELWPGPAPCTHPNRDATDQAVERQSACRFFNRQAPGHIQLCVATTVSLHDIPLTDVNN